MLSLLPFATVSVVLASAYTSIAASSGSFSSEKLPNTSLRYVKNSGICETTPGVTQYSGYIDIGTNMSMWFWFFESRSTPSKDPFTLWLNGGPGCSSMIGLFQENGPCRVNDAGNDTTLNPYSWNELSNVLYIDQPIGTGFSFGTDTVNSTFTAAPPIWTAFQVLFESKLFHKYESREFILATESYGGHYGPEFVTYFDQQNEAIGTGKLNGELITVTALVINNGWYDPLIQNEAYVNFAANAPGYGPLVNSTVLAQLNESFYGANGCRDQELACYAAQETAASNKICKKADAFCTNNIFTPAVGDRDSYDLRAPADDPFPSESYVKYLHRKSVATGIGAETKYRECPDAPFEPFVTTGDDARTLLPQLSTLVDSGLRTLLWAGDADINCNWLGGHASALAMKWSGQKELNETPLVNMTIHGKAVAQIQNVKNFSFARVFAAGHEVPAYQPEVALEIFRQIVAKEELHSI